MAAIFLRSKPIAASPNPGVTMLRRLALLFITIATPALAQHGGGGTPIQTTAPREASQFDFLAGQWDITVRPLVPGLAARIHGSPRLSGTWRAWRSLDNWGLEDEMRIIDGSGNPMSLSHTVRVYDAAAQKWTQTTLDVYRARFTTSTAQWQDGRMTLSTSGTDPEGHAYQLRTVFSDITPTSFKFQQDRSLDDGRTWTEGVLRIEARRTAAAAAR
jgi:hypothetical protein